MADLSFPADWWPLIGGAGLTLAVLAVGIAIAALIAYRRESARAAQLATERAEKVDRLLFTLDQRTLAMEKAQERLAKALSEQHHEMTEGLGKLQGEAGRHRRDLIALRDEVINQTTAKLQANETIAALLKRPS